jgi:hypothetical protein
MSTEQNFDEIKAKLEGNYFYTKINLSDKDWKPILYFSLVWNLFESQICKTNANRISIELSIDKFTTKLAGTTKLQTVEAKYNNYFNWFRPRYTDRNVGSKFKALFNNKDDFELNSTETHMKGHLELVLNGKSADIQDVIKALLFIAYRIRNNFFHGNKNINDLINQTDLFIKTNQLLLDYMEDVLHS